MYKIQTLNKISEAGLRKFDKGTYAVSDNETDPDAMILRSLDMHTMKLPESLLAVARAGAGVNNIPIDKCSEKGVAVFNTPGANANAVKELVIAGLMLSSRKIWQGINWAQDLKGQQDVPKLVEKGKAGFGGSEIKGKTVGIVGVGGAIGLLVANACAALGMDVVGTSTAKPALSPEVKVTSDLDEVFKRGDYITLHAPYNTETKHMVNAESIAKMKKGVIILNFARGELVNDEDIKAALADGKVGCYVTDFPNEALLGVEGVITVPHLGASTEESEENCASMAAEQLKEYLEKGNVVNSVNFPALSIESPGKRICVLCGVPEGANGNDEFKAIEDAIKNAGGNENVSHVHAVRKGLNYHIAVLQNSGGSVPGSAAQSIAKLPGVISVRVI